MAAGQTAGQTNISPGFTEDALSEDDVEHQFSHLITGCWLHPHSVGLVTINTNKTCSMFNVTKL